MKLEAPRVKGVCVFFFWSCHLEKAVGLQSDWHAGDRTVCSLFSLGWRVTVQKVYKTPQVRLVLSLCDL